MKKGSTLASAGAAVTALAAAAVLLPAQASHAETAAPRACTAPPSGMVSWYPGQGNGDDIRGGRHGTLNGVTFAPGKVNEAFSFDGTDDTMTTPAGAAPTGSSARTFELWLSVSAGSTAPDHEIFFYGAAATRHGFGLDVDGLTGGNVRLEFFTFGDDLAVDSGVPPGQFMHVAGTYDGATTLELYVNGTLKGTKTVGGVLNTASSGVTFGKFIGFFGGMMDEISFFDRRLAESEIDAIVAAGSDGKCGTSPTAATLDSFSAKRTRGAVLLRWRAAAEIGTLGYIVFRQHGRKLQRLTAKLIPARHGTAGGIYTYTDHRPPRANVLRYWIQAVDARGSRGWHGPATAVVRP